MNKLSLPPTENKFLGEPLPVSLSDTIGDVGIDEAEQVLGVPRRYLPEGLLAELVREHIEGQEVLSQLLIDQATTSESTPTGPQ